MRNLLIKAIKKYQESQDLLYEIQKLSHEIRTKSKQAITLLRVDKIKESKKKIRDTEKQFRLIKRLTQKNKDLLNQNFYKEAVEEYIEAMIFYNFLTKLQKEIPTFVNAQSEEIISGTCDFTGELVRKAITIASSKNLKKLTLYQKTIENIIQEVTKVGFQGKLRQKYDGVERNLKRLEGIIYDIRLRK